MRKIIIYKNGYEMEIEKGFTVRLSSVTNDEVEEEVLTSENDYQALISGEISVYDILKIDERSTSINPSSRDIEEIQENGNTNNKSDASGQKGVRVQITSRKN